MDVVLGALVFLLIAWLTVVIWRYSGRRAAAARIEPTQSGPPVPAAELRTRIAAYCAEHPALVFREDHHGDIEVTWRIEPMLLRPEAPLPESTQALEIRLIAPSTAFVRYGEGRLKWLADETGGSGRYHPNVEWLWNMLPEFGRRRVPGEPLPEPEHHHPHSIHGLEIPIRRIVLDAGWSWQPVLDLPDDADDLIPDVGREHQAMAQREPGE